MTAVFRTRMPQLRTNVMAPKTVPKVPYEYSVMRFQYKTMDFDQTSRFLYPDSGIFGSHFINMCITLTNPLHLDESLHKRLYADNSAIRGPFSLSENCFTFTFK